MNSVPSLWIEAVGLIEVDRVDTKATEAGFGSLLDVLA